MQVYTTSRRPSERTEEFLQNYVTQRHHQPGDRLPSPRQIATELNVSESTVRSVIRKWLQDGKLRSRQGSGIFINEIPSISRTLRIGANVRNLIPSDPEWGTTIHLHALKAVIELGPKGSFTSLYSLTEVIDDLPHDEVSARCRDLDGMILYQSDLHGSAIAAYCKKHGKPLVYMNPPSDDAVSNFVSMETFTAFYRITRALRDSGRKRFLMLINPNLERSVTIRQRLSGIINGIGEWLGVSAELRILLCKGYHDVDGKIAVKEFLEKDTFRPDAILCAGDGLALGAFEALNEQGISVPKDVSLISGSGFDVRIKERKITSLSQPLQDVGQHLVSLLLSMIEQQVLEAPAHILPIDIYIGNSTTLKESRMLESLFRVQDKKLC